MISTIRVAFLTILALALPAPLQASTFHSSYVEFELPDEWTCALEQTEWVCSDEREGKQRTAIIILTAKLRGDEDRLEIYEDHLATTRPVMDPKGNQLGRSSRVEFVQRMRIGARIWIHGRQYESEVPSFYTDYLATTDDQVSVLVTFSSHRDYFDRAYARFVPSILSIRPRKP